MQGSNTQQNLAKKFEQGYISKQELGQLRRLALESILNEFEITPNSAVKVLNTKRTKIDLKKLSTLIGYDIRPVNIRQSFKDMIISAEIALKTASIITTEKDTNEKRRETAQNFIAFIKTRLDEPTYEWPTNLKGNLYRKAIWAYFLDTPLEEVEYTSPLLTKNTQIAKMLADIDVKIANNEVKKISFSSDSALDEMSETMKSRAISKLRQQLKEMQEKVTEEREARLKVEKELEQFKQAKKRLLGSTTCALTAGSIY